MDVIREERIRSIGNGRHRSIGPSDMESRLSSDMGRFCAGCSRFAVVFETTRSCIRSLRQGERIEGSLVLGCRNRPADEWITTGATLQWTDRKRVGSDGKMEVSLADVPPTLRTQLERAIRGSRCVIARNCMDCEMYMERMISEGS